MCELYSSFNCFRPDPGRRKTTTFNFYFRTYCGALKFLWKALIKPIWDTKKMCENKNWS